MTIFQGEPWWYLFNYTQCISMSGVRIRVCIPWCHVAPVERLSFNAEYSIRSTIIQNYHDCLRSEKHRMAFITFVRVQKQERCLSNLGSSTQYLGAIAFLVFLLRIHRCSTRRHLRILSCNENAKLSIPSIKLY